MQVVVMWDMFVTELPYWHLEHEVVLAEAEADVGHGAVEEAGGSEHQDQVEVPGERRLQEGEDAHGHINDGGGFRMKQTLWI